MSMHLVEDLAGLAGVGILVCLAAAWLLRRAGRASRSAGAVMDGTAAAETGILARHGHAMTSWRMSPALAGLAGSCAGCGGLCLVTATTVTYHPPLADGGRLLSCPGGAA